MARMTFKAGDEYAVRLSKLEAGQKEIADKALTLGAGIVCDEIRERLEMVLSGESSGELEESLGITPLAVDKQGNYNKKVGFDGYDSKTGVPNQLKARALESGTSTQRKRPFARPAVKRVKQQAIDGMNLIIDYETQKIMKG